MRLLSRTILKTLPWSHNVQNKFAGFQPDRKTPLLAWLVRTVLILSPIVAYYWTLSLSLSRLPFGDDYRFVLEFLQQWKHTHGFVPMLKAIVVTQDEVYKLIVGRVVYAAMYSFSGVADLRAMSIVGNLFALPIVGALYLFWKRSEAAQMLHLDGFIPVVFLFFQLQYAAALNSAFAPMQYLPTLLFALLCIYYCVQERARDQAVSMLCFVLAAAASGNGLFLLPVCMLHSLLHRKYLRLLLWLLLGCAMAYVIVLLGSSHSGQRIHNGGFASMIFSASPVFALAFLGAVGAAANPLPATILGCLFVASLLYATWRKAYRTAPHLYYLMLFLVMTAIAVSALRAEQAEGLVRAIGSRYRIYSTLLLIANCIYFAGLFKEKALYLRRKTLVCVCALLALGAFDAVSDWEGNKLLETRRMKTEAAILRWERHEPRPAVIVERPGDYTVANEKLGQYEPHLPFLTDYIDDGIYRLPSLPEK